MNNDIIFISDTHFGCKSFSKKIFETQMQYFENELFPYILKNKIKNIIHSGDFVHNRNFIDLFILQEIKTRLLQWFEDNEVNFYCLVGNHDSVFKNNILYNFQQINLSGYKFIHPIIKNTNIRIEDYKFGFVPWIYDLKKFKLPKPEDIDIMVGHFEVKNSLMQGTSFSVGGMKQTLFKDYKLVLSGHYHATSRRGNLQYIGAQYQMDWGDFGNEKGFWILKDKLKLEFVKNTKSPKHLKIYYNEDDKGDITLSCDGLKKIIVDIDIIKGRELCDRNYIKFIVKKNENQVLLADYFEKITESAYDRVDVFDESGFIEEIDERELAKNIKEDANTDDIIMDFMKSTTYAEGIDGKKMSVMMEDLLKRSKENNG